MRYVNALAATVVSVLLMVVLTVGGGPVPALGHVLDPAGGVWNWGRDAATAGSQTVRLHGMRAPATVSFDSAGVPTVRARSDRDLYLAEGYLHATFRLTQLDQYRRVAEGRLSELAGPSTLESDRFELQIGLLRTAQALWADTQKDSPEAQALIAYSEGVNDRLAELRRSGDWPGVFTLTGLYPRDWTPVDSLAIQNLLSQQLTLTSAPLNYAWLVDALGKERTMQWFPVLPVNDQRPYDVGPYRNLGVSPLPAERNANAAVPGGGGEACTVAPASLDTASGFGPAERAILTQFQRLPQTQTHTFSASNSWVANGPAVAGGRSMLAGDPHLQLSLPSYWYQLALSAPETEVTGASLVGLPGVVIGHNARIAWSMTDVQNQSTLFYREQTSPDRPGQYCWQGKWRHVQTLHYTIPVRGGADVPLTVDLTVHGPMVKAMEQTVAISWMGDYPAHLMRAILAVNKAGNYQQFREALSDWHSPTLNFTYADDQGNIAIMAAGYFPIIKAGEPWLPLSGTGGSDIVGTIPYAAAPQVYNPPSHVAASANQRPVGPDYPYYIGTSLNAFDNGYRADQIYAYLESHPSMTADDFRTLQMDVTDNLATRIVPRLTKALADTPLDGAQRAALDQLRSWDSRMTATSPGASIWWTFWSNYLSVVFQPWWDATHVRVDVDPQVLSVSAGLPSLDEDLEAWTLRDPDNPAFSPPGRPHGDAATAMRAAFAKTVSDLRKKLGDDPSTWQWSRLHTREIPSLLGAAALGYGPKPSEGDRWTVNAAEGDMNSSWGPSWRMVIDWTGTKTATATAVYPGGQSDNPTSPWYRNFIADWWNGRQRPMPPTGDTSTRWTLTPAS
ncbi:MAG TPA: penicillin acylase family protein [Micromonosporaceae bacterium]